MLTTPDGPAGHLTLQFLAWIGEAPRSYGEAMDAWRTSCPRLSIWEDALQGGLIEVSEALPSPLPGGARGRDLDEIRSSENEAQISKSARTALPSAPTHQAEPPSPSLPHKGGESRLRARRVTLTERGRALLQRQPA